MYKIFDITSGCDVVSEIKRFASNASLKENAVNSSDMVDTILTSLNQPKGGKSIATFLLYDELGLQLFEGITRLDEYYLTNAERTILQHHADELAIKANDGMNIVELGSGSLTKTQVILNAMERNKKRVTYYALDLNQNELERSLSSLSGQFTYVQLVGLLGTYEQAIPWIKHHCTTASETRNMILWLGSSIGNLTRRESAIFLRRFVRNCLRPADLFVIGFDRRNDPSMVSNAYNDKQGITQKFVLNALNHVNSILAEPIFNLDDFEYHSMYQENYGRHICHLLAKRNVTLTYRNKRSSAGATLTIPVEQGELIHLGFSHKYSVSDIANIVEAAELDLMEMWSDSNHLYRLVVCKYSPLKFNSAGDDDILDMFFPYDHGAVRIRNESNLQCLKCNT